MAAKAHHPPVASGADRPDANPYRFLPSVERLASDAQLGHWGSPAAARSAARAVLEGARSRAESGQAPPGTDELLVRTDALMESWLRPGPVRVINAAGVILHTNLGRAPLSAAAQKALATAAGYCSVEFDVRAGRRSSRQEHLRPLLRIVSGAEDGLAVTNNAAAILLILRALCYRREVLVSRGEAVAIGDGFRIPSIVAASGVRLVDVGTTNRTTADDYEAAITARTAAILRVHPSNFTIVGFTERPTTQECAAIARKHGILLIDDVGSGWLERPITVAHQANEEPVVREVLAAGADIVTCSADKLCGGPQAGLIFTSKTIADKLRRHPVARAVRPDKLIVAALAATLASYARGTAGDELPVLRMMTMSSREIEQRAQAWCEALTERGVPAVLMPGASTVGGGALPATTLPTTCLTVADQRGTLYRALASQEPAIVARVGQGRLWLDPRTVDAAEDDIVLDQLVKAWEANSSTQR
jgi:L-seryl-tRNA(Ser) seleniumtransferase